MSAEVIRDANFGREAGQPARLSVSNVVTIPSWEIRELRLSRALDNILGYREAVGDDLETPTGKMHYEEIVDDQLKHFQPRDQEILLARIEAEVVAQASIDELINNVTPIRKE